MIITRKILVDEAKILGTFALLSIVQVFLTCRGCTTVRTFVPFAIFTLLLWTFLWRGNSFLSHYLSEKISWIHEPVKRFTVGLVVTVGYTLLSVFLLIIVFETYFGFQFGGGYYFTILTCVLITLLISLFLHSREFLNFWRKASFDSAKFQRESIAARYETLKSRVNPAFLFHSLNTLSELVPTDEEKAVRYIKQLADVYRYMLETREKEAAPISEEVVFMNSYAALVEARYGTELRIELSADSKDRFVLPLAAHMIIECVLGGGAAIPSISVTDKKQYVKISFQGNLIPEQNATFEDVMNKIKGRYAFVSDSPVKVVSTEEYLVVMLPVMTTYSLGDETHVMVSNIPGVNGGCE